MCTFAKAGTPDAQLLCPWCILKCHHGSAAKAGQRVDFYRQVHSVKPACPEATDVISALLRWCEATATPSHKRPCRSSSSSYPGCEDVPLVISGDNLPHVDALRPLARGSIAAEIPAPTLKCGSQIVPGPPPGLERLPPKLSSMLTSVDHRDGLDQKWIRYARKDEDSILENVRAGCEYTHLCISGRQCTVHHAGSEDPYQVREHSHVTTKVRINSALLL